ncbi:MAG: hypothetical protein JWM73_1111 [Solirubrobacterales bacterium]|jgi:hypothetical protein|nr:hypothetical protein [Solirubrobacterales bacterium]
MRKLLLVVGALTLTASTAPASAANRSCSDGDRFLQQLKTTNLGCATGRQIMFRWAKSSACIAGGDGLLADRARTCGVVGFRCVPKPAEGGVRVTCTSGEARARFFDSQG